MGVWGDGRVSDEMPDPDIHVICQRCGKWFDQSDGQLSLAESKSASAFRIAGGGSGYGFQCDRCSRIRRMTKAWVWALFLGLVGTILVLERLGFLK